MSFFIEKIKTTRATIASWRNHSLNRKIASAALVIAVFTGFAKIAFFFKEVIVAWHFGTQDALDAFLVAYIVPSFIVNLVAGTLNAALIPAYIQVRQNEGRESAKKLYESTLSISVFFLTGCMALVVFAAPFYLKFLASGFSPEKLQLTLNLLYVASLSIVLSSVSAIRSAILNAIEKFAVPSFVPVVTPLLTIFLVFVGGRYLGIYTLALGLVFGQIIESTVLGSALRRHGISTYFGWHGMDANLRKVVGQLFPMAAGTFLMGSNLLVDQAFAASLSSGSVSILNYGNKVISFPLHIASAAIGASVLPYFSSIVAAQDRSAGFLLFKKYLKYIFLTSVPLSLLLAFFSVPLVHLLLQRGAFTEQDAEVTARVFTLGVLQIPFYLGIILSARLIAAFQANYILTRAALVNAVLNILMDYILTKFYGVAGIALSSTVVYFLLFLILLYSVSVFVEKSE
jgi:putative peptidoglycan lipid II flippase